MRYASSLKRWAALAVLAALTACNTVEGIGEDIAAGGRALKNTAQRTSN